MTYTYIPQGRLFPEDDGGAERRPHHSGRPGRGRLQRQPAGHQPSGGGHGRSGGHPPDERHQCGFKPTSCPDQLATALEQALQQG